MAVLLLLPIVPLLHHCASCCCRPCAATLVLPPIVPPLVALPPIALPPVAPLPPIVLPPVMSWGATVCRVITVAPLYSRSRCGVVVPQGAAMYHVAGAPPPTMLPSLSHHHVSCHSALPPTMLSLHLLPIMPWPCCKQNLK